MEESKENLDNNFVVEAVQTNISKAFNCIPNNLFIAKLPAYGLNSDSLCYIYSYVKDRKQCVQKIMNKASLTQSYQVYPKAQFLDQFYIIFFLTAFVFIPKVSVHNFADNTLASFASTLEELLPILESECEAKTNWLHNNKMIVNPDTFQVILPDKRGSGNTNIKV